MDENGRRANDWTPTQDGMSHGKRWSALMAVCLGTLLVMLDVTIVNVALPFIRKDLSFTEISLVWVVNAYLLTFAGFLLLSGRLGDVYGHRRIFLIGILWFTLASVVCGLASAKGILIAGRAMQGVSGAAVVATALSQIVAMFTTSAERAKAIGIYSFVCAGGGSIGLVLGGILTSMLSWHWVFLINLPIGIAVWAWCFFVIPSARITGVTARPDFLGAIVGAASLMLAIFAIVGTSDAGWISSRTLLLTSGAAVGLALFFFIQMRAPSPLLPLQIFKLRNLTVANGMAAYLSAGYATWLFMSALYMERVLGYGAMQVGAAFIPANVLTSLLSLGLSAKLVNRFGFIKSLNFGLVLVVIAVALLIRAPLQADPWFDILPTMVLLGVGMGVAYNPLLLAAMDHVEPSDQGLASGVINSSFLIGGALGLAIITSVSDVRTSSLLNSGTNLRVALNGGYQLGFGLAALSVAIAATLGIALLKANSTVPSRVHAAPKALEPS